MAVEDAASSADLQQRLAQAERELAGTRDELAEAREREAEGLARETATAEILRVIASSPTDLQSVLDTVVASAMRVCGATDAHIYLRDGDLLRLASARGPLPLGPST